MAEETPNKDITFETPVTTVTEVPSQVTANIKFEKFKLWMNFGKWLVGTLGIAIVTMIINKGFKDRALGMDEISQYDRYATELLVLNTNPVKKRMIAQFFSKVTPSDKLKCGWEDYFKAVDSEYIEYNCINDKLYKKYDELMKKDDLSNYDKYKMNEIQKKLQLVAFESSGPVTMPSKDKSLASNEEFQKMITKKLSANDFEKLGFENLINKDYENAVNNFKNSYARFPTLHSVDEIYHLLKAQKPNSNNDWIKIYQTIIDNYSWSLPSDTSARLVKSRDALKPKQPDKK